MKNNEKEVRRLLRKPLLVTIISALIVVFSGTVWIVAQTANISAIFGSFWPSAPEVTAPSSGEISLNSFFALKNPSSLFAIKDADLVCGVDLIYFEDANHNTALLRDVGFVVKHQSIAARGGQLQFECDASKVVEIYPDGTISFRKAMNSTKSSFRPPIKILKACLWIGTSYPLFGMSMTFKSHVFQWPKAPGLPEWSEGKVVYDRQKPEPPVWPPSAAWALRGLYTDDIPRKLRPDAVECDPEPTGAYALFDAVNERPTLVFK